METLFLVAVVLVIFIAGRRIIMGHRERRFNDHQKLAIQSAKDQLLVKPVVSPADSEQVVKPTVQPPSSTKK
ncbi:MAG: hypothetical protein ABJH63_07005 [Rhizobiaceae bacterium]